MLKTSTNFDGKTDMTRTVNSLMDKCKMYNYDCGPIISSV